jgi:hypothetical protein
MRREAETRTAAASGSLRICLCAQRVHGRRWRLPASRAQLPLLFSQQQDHLRAARCIEAAFLCQAARQHERTAWPVSEASGSALR